MLRSVEKNHHVFQGMGHAYHNPGISASTYDTIAARGAPPVPFAPPQHIDSPGRFRSVVRCGLTIFLHIARGLRGELCRQLSSSSGTTARQIAGRPMKRADPPADGI